LGAAGRPLAQDPRSPFDCHRPAAGIVFVVVVMSAPQPTVVEALMYSLRSRGTKALEEPATKRRLSELSDDQVIEVGNRLQRLKPHIAPGWSVQEVKMLFQKRTRL
jgi:hypothetical protein